MMNWKKFSVIKKNKKDKITIEFIQSCKLGLIDTYLIKISASTEIDFREISKISRMKNKK
jgi:hypothetical protein